jgi:NADH:ubiquinone oxidoreductase subunit 6 (subunit J)
MKTGAAEWAISMLVGLLFLAVLIASLLTEKKWAEPAKLAEVTPESSVTTVELGEAFLGVPQATPDAKMTGFPEPKETAKGKNAPPPRPAPPRTVMSYLLPFEIVSVHLLVVLIGAAYLARAKRRRGAVS